MKLQYASTNFVKKNGGNCDHGRGNFNNWGGHDQIWNNLDLPSCNARNNKPICQICDK